MLNFLSENRTEQALSDQALTYRVDIAVKILKELRAESAISGKEYIEHLKYLYKVVQDMGDD